MVANTSKLYMNGIGMYAFITACSGGVTIGECPHSNYQSSFLRIGNHLITNLEGPKQKLPYEGCESCPFASTLEKFRELEDLVA